MSDMERRIRRDRIVGDLQLWYVGKDGDPRTIKEVGEWRDILNQAAWLLVDREEEITRLRSELAVRREAISEMSELACRAAEPFGDVVAHAVYDAIKRLPRAADGGSDG